MNLADDAESFGPVTFATSAAVLNPELLRSIQAHQCRTCGDACFVDGVRCPACSAPDLALDLRLVSSDGVSTSRPSAMLRRSRLRDAGHEAYNGGRF